MKKDVPLQTVQRSIEILEILKEDTIGVTELAERLDLPKSTVYDYLRTLRSLGYIIKENRKYRLAFKSLELGGYRKYHSQLYQLAKPEIKRLADKTGEIVSVNVEEQGRFIVLHSEIGSASLHLEHYPGTTTPLHTHAGGKVMLAEFNPEKVESIFERHGLTTETEHTITDRDELLTELETIRERGYAVDRDQEITGVGTLAAPIKIDDCLIGSVNIAFPANRLTETGYQDEIVQEIQKSTNIISVNYEHST
jgi:DNA-binding IclR family transcriptional regulator